MDQIDLEFIANLELADASDESVVGLMDYYTDLYERIMREYNPRRSELNEIEASYLMIWSYIERKYPEYLNELARRYEGTKMLKMIRRYNDLFELHGRKELGVDIPSDIEGLKYS